MDNRPITDIDTLVIPGSLQAVKACIPFLPYQMQKMIYTMIKLEELKSTVEYFKYPHTINTNETTTNSASNILEAVKVYLDDEISQTIDMLINIISMKDMMKDMDFSNMDLENLGDLTEMFNNK